MPITCPTDQHSLQTRVPIRPRYLFFPQADYERLSLSVGPYLERNMEELIECIDAVHGEQVRWH